MAVVLTQEEADELLEMLKKCADDSFEFPSNRKEQRLRVEAVKVESKNFIVIVNRKNTQANDKISYIALYKSNSGCIRLLRLDLGKTIEHTNPKDGKVIKGAHLHFYLENYGDTCAEPFDMESSDFVENFYKFLELFNVLDKPKVIMGTQESI